MLAVGEPCIEKKKVKHEARLQTNTPEMYQLHVNSVILNEIMNINLETYDVYRMIIK